MESSLQTPRPPLLRGAFGKVDGPVGSFAYGVEVDSLGSESYGFALGLRGHGHAARRFAEGVGQGTARRTVENESAVVSADYDSAAVRRDIAAGSARASRKISGSEFHRGHTDELHGVSVRGNSCEIHPGIPVGFLAHDIDVAGIGINEQSLGVVRMIGINEIDHIVIVDRDVDRRRIQINVGLWNPVNPYLAPGPTVIAYIGEKESIASARPRPSGHVFPIAGACSRKTHNGHKISVHGDPVEAGRITGIVMEPDDWLRVTPRDTRAFVDAGIREAPDLDRR